MIENLVIVIHILTCLALILAILLQSGKGGGVSAAFGGGAGQALGQRGATTVLGRFTGFASAVFMVTSMALAIYSTSEYRDETLRDIPEAEDTKTSKDEKKAKAVGSEEKKNADQAPAADSPASTKPNPNSEAPAANAEQAPTTPAGSDSAPAPDAPAAPAAEPGDLPPQPTAP